MKYYLYVSLDREISLYGEKGYTFFHIACKGSNLELDKPRIRYDFTEYGWKEISAAQANEVLRDMLAPILRWRSLFNYEKIRIEEIRDLINA